MTTSQAEYFVDSGDFLVLPIWVGVGYEGRPLAHPHIRVPVSADFWQAWHVFPGESAPQIELALRTMMPFLMQLAVMGQRLVEAQEKLSPEDIVTEVDIGLEGLFRMWITRHFPEDRIIGEEGFYGQPNEPPLLAPAVVWIIDPIDGTSNYAAGDTAVVIQLCRLRHGLPELAVMGFPFYERLETAAVGGPVWPVVSGRPEVSSTFCVATEYREDRIQEGVDFAQVCHQFGGKPYRVKSIGVNVYSLGAHLDFVFYKPRIKIWDIYPPLALLRLRQAAVQMQICVSCVEASRSQWVDPFSSVAYASFAPALAHEGRIGHVVLTSQMQKNTITAAIKERLLCMSLF